MAKLNQIVAVVNGKKSEAKKALTAVHRKSGAPDLFSGLSRTYEPLDAEGETLPPEKKAVQFTADEALSQASTILTELFDVVAVQDVNNTRAIVDVVVDGNTVVEQVPVTYLMFLEKQLNDVDTFVRDIPTLDSSQVWDFDENQGLYASEPVKSTKTKKTPQHKVLYEATENHPAQIETWNEDVVVGTYTTRKFSGAISTVRKQGILQKVRKLKEAVKFAREEANSITVEDKKVGDSIFGYLFD